MIKFFNLKFGLSANTLKIIACIAMAIDHVGLLIFPNVIELRIIGRLAFPIFAFMIAEGCVYTKNKLKYFLSVFILGIGCQIVYYFYGGNEIGILLSFSISILLIYFLQYIKNSFVKVNKNYFKSCVLLLLFLIAVAIVYLLNLCYYIDYGFWGCLAPVFASLLRAPTTTHVENEHSVWKKLDKHVFHVIAFTVSIVIISFTYEYYQVYALLAIPLLLLYTGKRGRLKMKYFFYIFYPVHMALIEAVAYFLVR